MSIWKFIILLLLAVTYVKPDRILPYPNNAGIVIKVLETGSDPIPKREYLVKMGENELTAIAYENGNVYQEGDDVILMNIGDNTEIADKLRIYAIIRLTLIFVAVVVMITGGNGLRSLTGLVFSFGVIFNLLIPLILAGYNPLPSAIITATIILIFSYLLTHGTNSKSYIAMVGTISALILSGLLSVIFAQILGLNGFESEEAMFLTGTIEPTSIYNLMLAGIMIGTLGVLDDITIAQASIVSELHKANQRLIMKDLYQRAMIVGHDHISSMINTLVLVYAGSSLPLLLLFVQSGVQISDLLSYQAVATEILRTLAGSTGLVMAVPITTGLASIWYSRKT